MGKILRSLPQQVLVIILGAHEWPYAPQLCASSEAFLNSAKGVKEYFLRDFGLREDNLLDLFDTDFDSPRIDTEIESFFDERIDKMKRGKTPIEAFLVYYIGHGIFAETRSQELLLAIKGTKESNTSVSSIRMADLSTRLVKQGKNLRGFYILDCCYAAEAFKDIQGDGDNESKMIARRAVGIIEESGPTLGGRLVYCSSGKDTSSKVRRDHASTWFTWALLKALKEGNNQKSQSHLSFYQINEIVHEIMKKEPETLEERVPLPSVLPIKNTEIDILQVPFFRNSAKSARSSNSVKRASSAVDITSLEGKDLYALISSIHKVLSKSTTSDRLKVSRIREIVDTARGIEDVTTGDVPPIPPSNIEAQEKKNKKLADTDKKLSQKPEPRLYYEKGELLKDLNSPELALEAFEQAVKLDSEYALAYEAMADILFELDRIDEALESVNQAIKLDPEFVDAYLSRGRILEKLERFDEAYTDYTAALELEPDDKNLAILYYNIAGILIERKNYEEAFEYIEKSLKLNANRVDSYYNKGIILEGLKRLDEAIQAYDEAIKREKNYVNAYLRKGDIFLDREDYKEALNCYNTILGFDPDNITALAQKGFVYIETALDESSADIRRERYENALDIFNTIIDKNPTDAIAYYNKGLIFNEYLNKLDDALLYYDESIRLDPTYGNAYINKAGIYEDQEKFDEADQVYQQMIESDIDVQKARRAKKDLDRRLGR